MNESNIKSIYRDLNRMAFYLDEDENCYRIDESAIEPTYLRISSYITEFQESKTSRKEQEHISRFVVAYNEFKTQIEEVRITEEAFTIYLAKAEKNSEILNYEAIKRKLKYAIVELLGCLIQYPDKDIYDDYTSKKKSRPYGTAQKILNHNNPFADITIENQDFLYPNTDGVLQTLSFNVGYTMTKLESDSSSILALQPDFKISKSVNKASTQVPITMDDTFTSPMPDVQGERNLLYI